MNKTFYLFTQKNYISKENGKSTLDVGVFIEKIILSTESEDFKEYLKEVPTERKDDIESIFDEYENYFIFYYEDQLKNERKSSHFEEIQIYSHLLLSEQEYMFLMKQTEDIPTREVLVNELV